MSVITNIKNERNRQHIRQTDLAEAMGVSVNQIYRIENNRSSTSLEMALRLANYLHCPVETLFSVQEGE